MTSPVGPADARLVLHLAGLPGLRMEHGLTRRVLAAIPDAHFDARPAPGVRSAGELARHIAVTELRFLEGAVSGTFAAADPELDAASDAATIAAVYAARAPRVHERIAGLDGEALLRVLDYRGVVRMPALGFVQFAINHTIHHRGQLSVVLKAAGVQPPPIYG